MQATLENRNLVTGWDFR